MFSIPYDYYGKDKLYKGANMAKQKVKEVERSYFGIICTETEKDAVWEKLNKSAGKEKLTVSNFFLRSIGIRKK